MSGWRQSGKRHPLTPTLLTAPRWPLALKGRLVGAGGDRLLVTLGALPRHGHTYTMIPFLTAGSEAQRLTASPPPPSLPSPWEERATPGRTQWGLYQTAHQSLIKKLGIFLGLSRFDSYKESVTMPSLVFKCRRWNAPFRSAKRALCQRARKLKTEHFHVKKQQKHCDTFKGYRCLVIWVRSIDNRM